MPAFALTIFTGAFLLFQVQPLIGKYILPWFGGSPGVWTTCMLFFQMLLLGGYAYAHVLSKKLQPRAQAIVHLVLLAAALASLPITPGESWKAHANGDPTWHILALLAVSLGLPYFVLAATGPLMQEWFRRTTPGASPYRLYALSNVGSLLALISYPFYFETQFTRLAQAKFWSWGLVFYALCCGLCAWRVWRHAPTGAEPAASAATDAEKPSLMQRALWVCLPACASILLLAVTNKMCQDVAVIPFLWVLPLALYLLSFIICFDSPRWYSRFYYTLALVAALIGVTVALFQGADMDILHQVVIYSGVLFAGCMICHGELYHLKPHPQHLTSFYLMISAGGAVGGLFVALIAPSLFTNYYETHLSFALIVALLLVVSLSGRAALTPARWRVLFALLAVVGLYGLDRGYVAGVEWLRTRDYTVTPPLGWNWDLLIRLHWFVATLGAMALLARWLLPRWRERPINGHLGTCGLLGAGLVVLVGALGVQISDSLHGSLISARNFYGVLSVFQYKEASPDEHYYLLQHGRITHGIQFASPQRAPMITSYFSPNSGLGLAMRNFPRQQNQRVGLLGLGVGTVTAYGKPGDYFRIYEINPQVEAIAANPFSYLARSQAKIELVMGDGRLSMENEPPQAFDILIMDAFSSDAVPVHLLTKEAFAIYVRHLKPDGAILVNISNRYLDLRPVVENAAQAFGFQSVHINNEDGGDNEDDGGWWLYASTWMILSKNKEFLERPAIRNVASPAMTTPNTIPLWTDDYTSMFKILQ
ncbi:fused MFS/spermidine synthase [Horticoccus sp. 23ND18S-11]|uniref:fused MFS/spermidine synthase n=1 Tax=Horticoccus sp. 23ND18S-11 TaxID=3391832 RepID=UPI0039C9D1DE